MSAYYIAEHIITRPEKYQEYIEKVVPMIARYGGRYLTKAGVINCPKVAIGNPSASSSSSFQI